MLQLEEIYQIKFVIENEFQAIKAFTILQQFRFVSLMIEQPTSSRIQPSNEKQKTSAIQMKEYTFSPLQELGLKYDKSNDEDVVELTSLLEKIIGYPSTELAEIHSEAMKLGNFDLEDQLESAKSTLSSKKSEKQFDSSKKLCPCCGFTRQTDSIKMATAIDKIKNMGTSTYLYFSTFKHLSLLLIIMGLLYSIFALATNIIASGNSVTSLSSYDYLSISLSSKQTNDTSQNNLYYYIQCWIGVAVVAIWGFVLFGIKYFQIKSTIEYDHDTSSCSDYSIAIDGIPSDSTVEQIQGELNAYYEHVTKGSKIHEARKKPLKVMKFNLGLPFYLNQQEIGNQQLKEVDKELKQARETFIQWIRQRTERPGFSEAKQKRAQIYKKYLTSVQKKNQIVLQIKQKIKKQLKQKQSDDLTTAFVTFETNIARDLMIQMNQKTIYSRLKGIIGDENRFVLHRGDKPYFVDIHIAPEPQDVIWTNIGLTNCQVYSRKLITFTITIILLGICFGVVLGLSIEQYNLTKDQTVVSNTARYLSIAISLVISLVNVILGVLIKVLTNLQRNYTTTYSQASLAIKGILFQMINSIAIPVIVAQYIAKNLYYTSGLVDNIFMMSFTNALVSPLLIFFDPGYFIGKLLRCIKTRPSSKLSQNQKDHNSIHLGPEFEVGSQYIYVVNLFMFACYFVSLQPICVFIALFGYLMMYWAQKYCMFYRYKRPVPSSDFVNKAVHQIIYFGPFLYSLGSLTWSNFMPNGVPTSALLPNLIALGISLLIVILPLNSILVGCFFSQTSAPLTYYTQLRASFSSEYDRMNPTTQEAAIIEYNKFLEEFKKNFQKMSIQKKQQLQKIIINNNHRGQLHNQHQAAFQPGFGPMGLNSFTQTMQNIVQQPMMFAAVYPQPMMPQPMQPQMMPQHQMNQPQPYRQQQPNYNQRGMNDQSSGIIMNPQPVVNPMSIFGPPMQQPMHQMPYNAMPNANMGMNGIFNQLGQMGMQQPGFNPMMNPFGNMGGYRMW